MGNRPQTGAQNGNTRQPSGPTCQIIVVIVAWYRQKGDSKDKIVYGALRCQKGCVGPTEVAIVEPALSGHIDDIACMDDQSPLAGAAGQGGIASHLASHSI